jgi:two-component system OmpR family response regulator
MMGLPYGKAIIPRSRGSGSQVHRMETLRGAKILVVDDDPDTCGLVTHIFAQTGAHVITAADGQEALRQFHAHKPDLVLLDVMMPDVDGWQVCRQIRQLSDVPVVMLTVMGQGSDVIRGFECGADDYVVKPFHPMILLARVQAMLRRAEPSSGKP